jgi:predicted ATPase/class 3 adenylate cyclase
MQNLPTGTVTYLFTDIEGSTKLWESHAQAMRESLGQHDTLLRTIVTEHGGTVFKAIGDAFYAVFPTAPSAIAAAIEAQRALTARTWEVPGGLRVRIALHTGTAEARDGDYFGPQLNRLARLLSAGHGGQILVSDTTRALVERELPASVDLRDLGSHRLKDLAHLEHIFQIVAADLRDDFLPLRSLDTLPNNLPRQLTSFIGRDHEIAELKTLLSSRDFITLTGSGGCGKTRLALQVAADLADTFVDGVWFIDLGPLAEPGLVPHAIASVLGVREELTHTQLTDRIADFLRPKSALFVTDNCEHVLAASAQLIHILLQQCPHIRILATSQQGLGVEGETTYRVPSLSLPRPDRLPSLDQLRRSEAVHLFVDRATLGQPQFTLTETNAPFVVQICTSLDGIPLAIELAAARVKTIPLAQIASRLTDRFRLLTSSSTTAPPRHQTLRAALDWSYELLGMYERALLRRLAVFAGGFTLEAAEAICSAPPTDRPDVFELVTQLVDKSLVVLDETGAQPRYRLLETVRLYSQRLLRESGEEDDARRRHAIWYLELAERADPALQGPEQVKWLDLLDLEHDNMRAALEWSKTNHDVADLELHLAVALWHFWEIRGYWIEGRGWLEEALAKNRTGSIPHRVKALNATAYLAMHQGDFARAQPLAEEALALAQEAGDKLGTASCLNLMGLHACRLEKYGQAAAFGQQSLALSQEAGDKWGVAYATTILGLVARGQGDPKTATRLLEEASVLSRTLSDKWLAGVTLNNLGLAVRDEGNLDRARAIFQESLALFRELGQKWGSAFAVSNLAVVAWDQRDYAQAASLFKESLVLRHELRDKQGIATCLVGLAGVAAADGNMQRAAGLFAGAQALRETINIPLPPFIRDRYGQLHAETETALGHAAFEQASAQGRAMPLEQVVAYALEHALS